LAIAFYQRLFVSSLVTRDGQLAFNAKEVRRGQRAATMAQR